MTYKNLKRIKRNKRKRRKDKFVDDQIKDYKKIIHPQDLALNDKSFLDSIKNGQAYKRTYRVFSKKGKELKWIKEQGLISKVSKLLSLKIRGSSNQGF